MMEFDTLDLGFLDFGSNSLELDTRATNLSSLIYVTPLEMSKGIWGTLINRM